MYNEKSRMRSNNLFFINLEKRPAELLITAYFNYTDLNDGIDTKK